MLDVSNADKTGIEIVNTISAMRKGNNADPINVSIALKDLTKIITQGM